MGFNFEKLDVYDKAIAFVSDVYALTKLFPDNENFGLTSQLRRAAVSIPSNIAEGSARRKNDFCRFLDIARGSVFECVTLFKVSLKQNYMTKEKFDIFEGQLTDISKMLSGLKRSVKNNKQRTTVNEQRTTNNEQKAFTLVEIMVAVGLLSIILAFSTMIFKVSLGTRRVAGANEDIMRKLRAITDQLNSDFAGLCKDTPLLIQFEQNPATLRRFDQIMFFSTGDFTSNQLYDYSLQFAVPSPIGNKIVRGNAARIYYGHADLLGTLGSYPNIGYFTRRQHILTADPQLYGWPKPDLSEFATFAFNVSLLDNEFFEHDSLSLAQWKVVNQAQYDSPPESIIPTCFASGLTPTGRTRINLAVPNTLHNLMCEGVESLAIQWAYWDGAAYLWYPDNTHFDLISLGTVMFGVRFNIPNDNASGTAWYAIESGLVQYNNTGTQSLDFFPNNFYPDALKFTFTLHDSHGVIKNGRTFTHIVYIGD